MSNTADVRKQNKDRIRNYMREGGFYTKQSLAALTGLSVATCNTLLNEMSSAGEVTGEKKRLNQVGPGTMVYQLNEVYENRLCAYIEYQDGKPVVVSCLVTQTGNILERRSLSVEKVSYKQLEIIMKNLMEEYPSVVQIILGIPGIINDGIVYHSDFPELDEEPLAQKLEECLQIPVIVDNDMRFKAYGYFKKEGKTDKVVTLANFPSFVLPGTATIHKGTVLSGANGLAGLIGVLTKTSDRELLRKSLNKEEGIPFAVKAVISVISVVNPNLIVFTGDMLGEEQLQKIKEFCQEYISEEFMPEFKWKDSFDEYYVMGMYHSALEQTRG